MRYPDKAQQQTWLQVGLNRQEQLIHISESPRGEACGLVCPYCGEPLVAKKGRVMIHHFAHFSNSCRPLFPCFDFWATGVEDTHWALGEFAEYYARQLLGAQQQLNEQHQNTQANWQTTKSLMAELLTLLGDLAKPYKNGSLPANRQVNHEVLTDVQTFLESPSSDRGPVPALYKVRHSQFSSYWNVCLKPDEWGKVSEQGYTVYPGRLWEEEQSGLAYIIPQKLLLHYQALTHYHRLYNELSDLTTEHDAFERTLTRFIAFNFYFLRIDLSSGTLYKAGVTSRPLAQRLTEIERDLRPLGVIRIEPMALVQQVGYLEAYFKRKYAPFRYALNAPSGPLTEYFDLPDEEVATIVKALQNLNRDDAPAPATRSERVRAGMRRAREAGKSLGRPKVAEDADAFLQKPKSQTILRLIQAGHSLREIERQTGYSINTIRKVNDALKPPTYRLADLIKTKRAGGWRRSVADEINELAGKEVVHPTTLVRIEQGHEPAEEVLEVLCQWLGVARSQLILTMPDNEEYRRK